jgi:octaprenyl-diphosphate synthase
LGDLGFVQHLCCATNTVCEGELHQQTAARDALLGEDEYQRIIYGKTAALTELAGRFGALAGTEQQRDAAAAFGRALGLAFQIADDCLDLSGDPQKVGKTLATDLERGRVTLPVIRVLAAEPALATTLLSAQQSPEQIAEARRLVVARGGVASALATARSHIAEARRHLAALPDVPARARLDELAEFVVAREA